MRIDADVVRHVAQLAELAVPEAQVAPLAEQLGGIVAFVAQLSEVEGDVADGTVTVGPERVALRADVVAPIALAHPVGSFAPKMTDGLFVVPKLGGMAEG